MTNPTVALEELAYQRPFTLLGALIAYLAEPHTGLLALLNHDRRALELLSLNGQRSLWCGVDAHGWISARQNLAVWITSLDLKRSELDEESLLNALKNGPTGCYSMLLSDNQPIEVIEEDSGAALSNQKVGLPRALAIETERLLRHRLNRASLSH